MDRKLFYIIKNVFALLIGRRNKRLGNFELCHIRQWSTAYLQMMCWLVPSMPARERREREDTMSDTHRTDTTHATRREPRERAEYRWFRCAQESGRDGGERDKGILPGPARFLSLSISLSFCRRTSPPRSGRVVRRSPASPGGGDGLLLAFFPRFGRMRAGKDHALGAPPGRRRTWKSCVKSAKLCCPISV